MVIWDSRFKFLVLIFKVATGPSETYQTVNLDSEAPFSDLKKVWEFEYYKFWTSTLEQEKILWLAVFRILTFKIPEISSKITVCQKNL